MPHVRAIIQVQLLLHLRVHRAVPVHLTRQQSVSAFYADISEKPNYRGRVLPENRCRSRRCFATLQTFFKTLRSICGRTVSPENAVIVFELLQSAISLTHGYLLASDAQRASHLD